MQELLLRQASDVRTSRKGSGTRKSQPTKPKKEAGDSASAAVADHPSIVMQAGLSWPPNWEEAPELSAACAQYCTRVREVIFWQDQRARDNEDDETIHDVNMSISWSNEGVERVPTIVCTSMYWLRKARRQLWGPELLALQGMDFHKMDISKYSHNHFTELAGNAFNGYACLAFLIAAFSSVPLGELSKARKVESSKESEVPIAVIVMLM